MVTTMVKMYCERCKAMTDHEVSGMGQIDCCVCRTPVFYGGSYNTDEVHMKVLGSERFVPPERL